MRFSLLLLLLSCARPTPGVASKSLDARECTLDADCELVERCCSCCGPVAMNHADAKAMRERCAVVDCSGDCSTAICDQLKPTRATCRSGTCVAE